LRVLENPSRGIGWARAKIFINTNNPIQASGSGVMLRYLRLVALVVCLASALGASLATPVSAAAQRMVDLGTLGGEVGQATDINDVGQVVGYASLTGDVVSHAFLWTISAGMQDLGSLVPGRSSVAIAISSSGEIVGEAEASDLGNVHAFYWDDGVFTDLGALSSDVGSGAYGINDNGQVVGYSGEQAAMWTHQPDGSFVFQYLGGLGGCCFAWAFAINNAGQAVGTSFTPAGQTHAFLWTAETGMTDLTPGAAYSQAMGINNQGQVVGTIETPSGNRAFLWENGVFTLFEPLTGGSSTEGTGINDSGSAVGSSTVRSGYSHAVLWSGGEAIDLGTLPGGRASQAAGVNAYGQVVGTAYATPGRGGFVGNLHPFLWPGA